MTAAIKDNIITARIRLLFHHPFFGNIATRLQLQENNTWCETAATDGRTMYYNTEFFKKMTLDNIVFVVAHEVLHMVFDHMNRVGYRNRKLWNIACDYAVNGILIRDKIGRMPDVKGFHDTKYNDKSAEEIYELLLEEHGGQDNVKLVGVLIDDHVDWGEGNGGGNSDDTNGDGNGNGKGDRPVYTTEELKNIRDEIITSVIQAVQCSAGKVPGEVLRLVKDLTEPKMNWRQMLRTQIQSLVKNDFTWTRPSRKAWHTGFVMPGVNYDQTIDVAIALDMSGSIGDDQVKDFLSEVKGIMDEFKDFKIDLWCFDCSIHNHATFTGDNAEDLLSYEAMGGGGTNFPINWDHMKDLGINPKRFIMFTDGYCDSDGFGDPDYCDTIFIMHNSKVVAPFGDSVEYSV